MSVTDDVFDSSFLPKFFFSFFSRSSLGKPGAKSGLGRLFVGLTRGTARYFLFLPFPALKSFLPPADADGATDDDCFFLARPSPAGKSGHGGGGAGGGEGGQLLFR